MSDSPSVTVIVPAFNVARWLPLLFECLDRQTFRDFQTIFVNDGSTDQTGSLLDGFAASRKQVTVLHLKNAGVSAARNAGVRAAAGEFLTFIDGDDAVAPHYLEDLYLEISSRKLDLALCNGWRFSEVPGDMSDHSLVYHPKPTAVMTGAAWFETMLNDGEFLGYVYTKMVRRTLLNQHHITFLEGASMGEDFLWVARILCRAERVGYTPKQSYFWRTTPGSLLRDDLPAARLRRIHSYIMVIEELFRLADRESPPVARLLNRLAEDQGRILLSKIAEIGSIWQRSLLSHHLRKSGFLGRLSRRVEDIGHWKRILRAYGFSWLGALFPDDTKTVKKP